MLLTELKADMAKYLATTPGPDRRLARLDDLIAFDNAHPKQEMRLFGQEMFEQAEKTKGLGDPATRRRARPKLASAGPERDRQAAEGQRVVALVGPTMPPAWKIDAVNGDQSAGGGAGSLAAVAGYPHLTVPMGLVKGCRSACASSARSGRRQTAARSATPTSRRARAVPTPKFYRSIEESPEIAPHLRPATHSGPQWFASLSGPLRQDTARDTSVRDNRALLRIMVRPYRKPAH